MPLGVRISQAGLDWSVQRFWIISGIIGAVFFVAVLIAGGGLLPSIGMAFAGGFGVPRWVMPTIMF